MDFKKELIRVTKQAYADKLFAATSGNLSMYDRETGDLYITPSGYPYELMTEDDVMVIDTEGNIRSGKHKPSSEWRLHAVLYKRFEEVNAVVHTHSPYATGFAVNNKPIPCALYEMIVFLGGDVPCAKRAMLGTFDVGETAAEVLKQGRTGCLMGNHGAVAVGSTLSKAYTRAVYIEDAAKACALAAVTGPIVEIPEEEIALQLTRTPVSM